jgi:glycosyltransferase involved in cell wall biosynthesis
LKNNTLHIWMNIPSFHQNDLFNELNLRFGKFEVVYAHPQDTHREAQGWRTENDSNYASKTIGKGLKTWQLVGYVFKNRKATHIVNGIWAEKSFFFVIILLNLFGADFLIYSEAPSPIKNRNFVKQFCLDFLIKPIAKLLIIKAKGFLAVSIFAENHFKILGVKTDKIYRFGYFRNACVRRTALSLVGSNFTDNAITKLIFIGQLIERKGILTLLEAIKTLSIQTQSFHLSIIGTGELAYFSKGFIEQNQLQHLVTLQGVVSSDEVPNYISKADLLILPSLFDGWGMVVNEALQCHIPALVSDQCGAKELIKNKHNGLIFKAKDVESLTEQLLFLLNLTNEERALMQKNTEQISSKISIDVMSDYLVNCLHHIYNPTTIKPIAPWLDET